MYGVVRNYRSALTALFYIHARARIRVDANNFLAIVRPANFPRRETDVNWPLAHPYSLDIRFNSFIPIIGGRSVGRQFRAHPVRPVSPLPIDFNLGFVIHRRGGTRTAGHGAMAAAADE